MDAFEQRIGYTFQNRGLLLSALTHSSFANEHRDREHNERLEFLGDAVLELSASDYLYHLFPGETEGSLSRRRASLVCEPSLAACARRIGLGEMLFLGKGEEKSGGREKDSVLSDALEAVMGAIYLDGGFSEAASCIRRILLLSSSGKEDQKDAKTRLQELLQRHGEIEILYQTQENDGDPEHFFSSRVLAKGRLLGQGSGHNKKLAEQAAAAAALDYLSAERNDSQ